MSLPDPRSALAEVTADPASRRRFLRLAGAGGAAALGTLLAACGSDSDDSSGAMGAGATPDTTQPAPTAGGDTAIVNYALTLEYLEAAFYADVVRSGMFKGAQQDLLKHIADTEQQHVDALAATVKKLGGTPAARPMTKFPLERPKAVIKLAATVENLGAAAYLDQAPKIKDKQILAAALAIHSVEARHAAALNELAGRSITPDGAFGKPASKDQVLAAVKPFIVA